MTIVAKDIANLTGGISQQAAPLRLYNQCEKQINLHPSLVNGLQNRQPLKIISYPQIAEGAFYPIDRDDDGKYNLIINSTGLIVTDEAGNVQSVSYGSGAGAYLAVGGNDYYNKFKVLTLADQTFILNTDVTTRLTNDIFAPWANQALVFIKQVQASTTWTLNINGTVMSVGYGGANSDTGLPDLYVNGQKVADDVSMSTVDVASRLSQGSAATTRYVQTADTSYNSAKTYYHYWPVVFGSQPVGYYPITSTTTGSGDNQTTTTAAEHWADYKAANNCYELVNVDATSLAGFTIYQANSTLWIRKSDGSAFTIGMTDTRSDTCSHLVTSKVQQFSDLPTVAPDGYICRVVGTVASNADDYYVMFKSNTAGTFSKGVWEECAAPGTRSTLNPNTMPYKLIHNANGTWTFTQVEWTEKETGDDDTVPIPSFVDKKLRNIFLYRNRLCFLTEDLVCMSAAAEYENFWNESGTTLTDSDPIFISASTEKVADLYDCGILDDDLIIFGSHGQYKFSAQDVLSPKTASITGIGKNAYAKGTGIIASGARLYFAHQNGHYLVVNEFGTSGVTGNKEANNITSHVPCLVPFYKGCRVAGTENTNTLAVMSPFTPDTLYMYQFYVTGSNRLQSSWHKFKFNTAIIKGIFFRDNLLWIFMVKNGYPVIATLDMAENTEDNLDTPVLDCLYTDTVATKTDTWRIPAVINLGIATVLEIHDNGVATIIPIESIAGRIITLKKEISSIAVGEKIDRLYQFTTPFIASKQKDGTEKTDKTGRWQLHKLNLVCGQTGDFKVLVKPVYDDAADGYVYDFNGITVGMQSSQIGSIPVNERDYQIPLRGRNTDINVILTTDSHLPNTFISAQWYGNYITKVKQI